MGKRSDFERVERDYYPTPFEAVLPLAGHLPKSFTYWEPCAGDGRLVNHLNRIGGDCVLASDIHPMGGVNRDSDFVIRQNAFTMRAPSCAKFAITNPVWDRPILHRMIDHFSAQLPTWLLFDADWMHTPQHSMSKRHGVRSQPDLMQYCHRIVSVGRVKWIEDSKMTGKDNCSWYLFDQRRIGQARFFPRP